MQLEDWLDDLCVRFIVNLPPEELASVERICFQVEEAQWFYEDFIRPLDPSLPSLSLKQFSLRIFQHCPLFSQWSAQHHMTAFAEFLAYKQRVPVRGAIMLSESMDEVVLVKGWKKGANWSFPRGKINKDENDLDCAVREVYEETGFDIKAAGLVKSEKEMKYIEVTMREQHMRLYVFRGVPKDTYFEPRTRKEISKIEWYKLHDLPTLKKKTHHENDEHPAINANKFYMVAPFLHPLKKWISTQKKRDIKHGSSGLGVPAILAEESATENDEYNFDARPQHHAFSPPALSSLPEVLPTQQLLPDQDPSAHLKELLNIGSTGKPAHVSSQTTAQQAQIPGPDATKSDALLALLRSGPRPPAPTQSQPQLSAAVQLPEPQRDIHSLHGSSQSVHISHSLPKPQQNLLHLFSSTSRPTVAQALPSQPAPYQQTGDPQFARAQSDDTRSAAIPPANALPRLTHHTKALLDAFQSQGQPENAASGIHPQPQRPIVPQQRTLLDVLRGSSPTHGPNPASVTATPPATSSLTELPSQSQIPSPQSKPSVPQYSSLLDLLRQPSNNVPASLARDPQTHQVAPAELAAAPVDLPKTTALPSQDAFLASLFKKEKPQQPARLRSPVAKVGQTGATIMGPLNQPDLQSVARTSPVPDQPLRRSPVPTSRVLYDPKQSTPIKILARPDGKQAHLAHQSRSPRIPKSHPAAGSPKRQVKPQEKPFQPQILRRPQMPDSRQSLTPSPSSLTPAGSVPTSRRPSNLVSSSPPMVASAHQVSEQTDPHKQTLLGLFAGTTPTAAPSLQKVLTKQPVMSPGTISPAAQSQIVSPITDEPISTRSRVGSLASIVSAGPGSGPTNIPEARPKVEKRQTAAEDKAFLLNYLGKFANQEG